MSDKKARKILKIHKILIYQTDFNLSGYKTCQYNKSQSNK